MRIKAKTPVKIQWGEILLNPVKFYMIAGKTGQKKCLQKYKHENMEINTHLVWSEPKDCSFVQTKIEQTNVWSKLESSLKLVDDQTEP